MTGEPSAIILRHYTADEAAQWAERWLSVFGRQRYGVNAKAYLWHVFSGERYPSIAGQAAWEAYRQRSAPEYIVLANDRKSAYAVASLPVASDLSDYCVFPPNLAWTMAFTHEDGWLGPYFARHSAFERLDRDNRNAVEKQRQVAEAKRKGWS